MTHDLAIVLLLLAASVVMFVINRPRMDVVALLMIVALPLTGVITVPEALAGFSDSNIVLIAALFVIGESLVRTGVARRLGDWLNRTAGSSAPRMLALLMLSVASLGSLMSSTAVVAIFIPVVLRICKNNGASPSKLMMPLSMAALTSGMLTLVATTPNLVVNSELVRQGHAGFGFFTFTPFGLPVLLLAVGYMLVASRFLPDSGASSRDAGRTSLGQWIEQYNLAEREHRARVLPNSPLVGQRRDAFRIRAKGINLLAVERVARFGTELIRPQASTEFQAGDVLLLDVEARDVDLVALSGEYQIQEIPFDEGAGYYSDRNQELGMAEVILPADSDLIGQTVLQARVRRELGLTVIGLRRGTEARGFGMLDEKLRIGDTLLMVGFWTDIDRLRAGHGDMIAINMPAEFDEVLPAASRAPQALAVLALVVVLMVTGMVPNVQAALIGCLLMGLLKCIDMNSAYESISWQTLLLIVGMLPFSIALQRTGGVDLAADGLVAAVGGASPRVVLAALFLITSMLGLFISNTATAVLMAPVALAVAKDLGASPYPFAMIVALGASAAFMTPISSPVNTLVVGPGNYKFFDFVKIGVPFTVAVLLVSVLLVPILLPL